jgi:hypothetical protein
VQFTVVPFVSLVPLDFPHVLPRGSFVRREFTRILERD